MNDKKLNWSPLDNTAKVYPALASKYANRVFRLFCQLKEPIQPELLQKAVDLSIHLFPAFTNTIRHGLFWYYREDSRLRPMVHREDQTPCQGLYNSHTRGLLIDISYYGCRINLEVFHALADGAGAIILLRAIVLYYLKEAHPELYPGPLSQVLPEGTVAEWNTDAFQAHFGQRKGAYDPTMFWKSKFPPVYRFKGQHTLDGRQLITEGLLSAQQIRKVAHTYQTTITGFLTAVLFMSVYDTMSPYERKRPICLVLPVNLRNYFASNTMRNFFVLMEVTYNFSQSGTEFSSVAAEVARTFREELSEEKMRRRVGEQVQLGKSPGIRFAPLVIKAPVIMLSNRVMERQHTMVLSNMGRITLPEEALPYTDYFGSFLSSATRQIVMCTLEDKMNICFSSSLRSRDVECAFFRRLAHYDPDIIVTTNYGAEVWK